MNIRKSLECSVLLIVALVTLCASDTIESVGKVHYKTSGTIKGIQYVSVTFPDRRNFSYQIDPNPDDSLYIFYERFFTEAFYNEAIVIITHDENNRILGARRKPRKLVSVTGNKPTRILRWKKPKSSTTAYNVGDSALLGGKYESLIDSNMWSPQEAPNYWRNKKEEYRNALTKWKKPSGSHDCYNVGAKVLYKGDYFESLINGNIWSPEEYRRGWKYIPNGPVALMDSSKLVDHSMPEPQTRTTAPTYSQPSGAHDAYKRGDVVSLNGTTYRSIIDANVWSPEVAQSYWEVLSSDTRTTVREWKKPTGVHDCYHKGYKMLFNGKTYESLMNSNVWSPEELPSSWKVVE